MFEVNFSHITTQALQVPKYQSLFDTKPWSDLDLSILQGLDLDMDLPSRAKSRFALLQNDVYADINVLDVLALVSCHIDDWDNAILANKACYHLWQSVLIGHNEKPRYALIMCLLQYHQSPLLYESLKTDIIFERLIKSLANTDHQWQDNTQKQILLALLNNSPKDLAKLSIGEKTTPNKLLANYQFSTHETFAKQAQQAWLSLYLMLDAKILTQHTSAINAYLTGDSSIRHALKQIATIFDHNYFPKDPHQLQDKIHKFTDIHHWLTLYNKRSEFLSGLSLHHRTILRYWLGAGHYHQLKDIISYIAYDQGEGKDGRGSISINRYWFWTNYQQHILDYCLLLPPSYSHISKRFPQGQFKMMLPSASHTAPIALLRFEGYYFIQSFILGAGYTNLIMTTEYDKLDNALKANVFNPDILDDLAPCLVHDHYMLWQSDAGITLLEEFNIKPSNMEQFEVTPKLKYPLRKPLSKDQHQERLTVLDNWYKKFGNSYPKSAQISYNSRFKRHGKEDISKPMSFSEFIHTMHNTKTQ